MEKQFCCFRPLDCGNWLYKPEETNSRIIFCCLNKSEKPIHCKVRYLNRFNLLIELLVTFLVIYFQFLSFCLCFLWGFKWVFKLPLHFSEPFFEAYFLITRVKMGIALFFFELPIIRSEIEQIKFLHLSILVLKYGGNTAYLHMQSTVIGFTY